MIETKQGKIESNVIEEPPLVIIRDVLLNDKTEDNLAQLLQQLIEKYPNYSITFPMFREAEEEYERNTKVLPKLGFKLFMRKPVFIKKVEERDRKYILAYKRLTEVGTVEPFKRIYCENAKESPYATSLDDSLFPEQAFEEYVMNKEKPEWNFLAYKDEELIGFFCLQTRDYFGRFGTLNYIAINPKHQGKGYAKDMLKRIENEFFDSGVIEWRESTDEKNIPMIKAFLRIGFEKKRELLGYVYNPEAAYKKFM